MPVNRKTQKQLDSDCSINGSILLQLDLKEFHASVPSSGVFTPEDGTDRLSWNVGKKLPLHTA